jgi:hypothetical protein
MITLPPDGFFERKNKPKTTGEKMKPRKVYRTRPVKAGAKKKQKIKAQKKMLEGLGCSAESLKKLTSVEVRELLKKKKMRKRGPSTAAKANALKEKKSVAKPAKK